MRRELFLLPITRARAPSTPRSPPDLDLWRTSFAHCMASIGATISAKTERGQAGSAAARRNHALGAPSIARAGRRRSLPAT